VKKLDKNKAINELAKAIIVCAFNTLKDGASRMTTLWYKDDMIKIHSYLNYKFDLKIDVSLKSKRSIVEVLGQDIKEILEGQK